MIGYYIHHHGFGHLARAMSIAARLRRPMTALSSLDIPAPHPFAAVVNLPRDDQADSVVEPTAHGALHWAPHHDKGFRARMDALARWVPRCSRTHSSRMCRWKSRCSFDCWAYR